MSLTLHITSYQRLSPGQETSKELDRGRLTIGRSPDNDWVLSDPEMVLSKSHCAVEYRDGTYYLTDTSTNGVFVNHSDQRLGRGNSVPLDDQDILSLGDYEIQVRVGDAGRAAPVPDTPYENPALESSDLFSVITEQVDIKDQQIRPSSSSGSSSDDPLALDRTIAPTDDSDPLGLDDSGIEAPDRGQYSSADHLPADREYFRPPEARPDPLASPPEPPPSEPSPPEKPPSSEAAPGGPTPVIPDDWEDSLILKSPLAGTSPPGAVADKPSGEESDPFDDLLGEDMAPPSPGVPDDAPGTRTERIDVSRINQAAESAPDATPPADVPPPTPEAPAARPPQPPSAPRTGGGETAALHAFLQGAGLADLDLSSEDAEAMMQRIGVIFRRTSQGMMELLRARSSVKNEFRVERTMIMAVENNPLKQLPNVEEAMKAMLTRRDNIWMPADKAIDEGFADIRAHELAMVAGMQAALKHLLETFDPQQLEGELAEHSRLGDLFGGRKARYWDAFKKLYDRLAARAEDDFQQLFRQEFAKAYEAQQQKLRQR